MSIAPLSVIALAVPAAAGAAFFLLRCGCWSCCNGSRDSKGCGHHDCFSRAAKCRERWPGCGGRTPRIIQLTAHERDHMRCRITVE